MSDIIIYLHCDMCTYCPVLYCGTEGRCAVTSHNIMEATGDTSGTSVTARKM